MRSSVVAVNAIERKLLRSSAKAGNSRKIRTERERLQDDKKKIKREKLFPNRRPKAEEVLNLKTKLVFQLKD